MIKQFRQTLMKHKSRQHSKANIDLNTLSSKTIDQSNYSFPFQNAQLRKSIFNPFPGLPESFAAQRHLAGAQVPRVDIVHYSPRWLLLQAPQVRPDFFQKANRGKLECRQQLVLKIFRSFAALTKVFGYFRPTEKMIFLQGREVRVWIHEDIFSNVPMMPIYGDNNAEKHFVIAFLAIMETYLSGWERASLIYTVDDVLKMLEWRCRLARGSRTAVYASREVQYQPEESRVTFGTNSEFQCRGTTSYSQHLDYQKLEKIGRQPTKSYVSPGSQLERHNSELLLAKAQRDEVQIEEIELTITRKKIFALNSTSSTIGAFSEQFRTTAGRKRLMERLQAEETTKLLERATRTPQKSRQLPSQSQSSQIQLQMEGLFAANEDCNEAELQRIAEQIEDVLFW